MPEPHPGRKSLRHLARVLEQKPSKDDHELSSLTQCLAEFREDLIRRNMVEAPSHGKRECLMHLNAIVSVVMGMHFPIGNPPWEEFEKTQDWLKDLVASVEGLATV